MNEQMLGRRDASEDLFMLQTLIVSSIKFIFIFYAPMPIYKSVNEVIKPRATRVKLSFKQTMKLFLRSTLEEVN